MRYGFTTGSCAAAAAKAAAWMLFFGGEKKEISIVTPKKKVFEAQIRDIKKEKNTVSCAVKKDAGDDPDVTDGLLIYSEVTIESTGQGKDGSRELSVIIDGGEGVGRVTQPGLDQPIGNAAINSVPRAMIEEEIRQVCLRADFVGRIRVTVSVPGGEKIAAKTFNPRLGIKGGISIIGTSGIVEPMSSQALLDTIKTELRQKKACGRICAAVTPGNYGAEHMKRTYGYDLDKSIKCSNFIGETIDMAAELGFEAMLLSGNLGKLIKLAGGIMNTHSANADCRMEILAAAALKENVSRQSVLKILDCVMTDEGLRLIDEEGKLGAVSRRLLDRMLFYLNKRAGGRLQIECIVYSNKYGELARSEGAYKWLILSEQDQEQRI